MIHRIKESPLITLVMGGVEEDVTIRTPPRIAPEPPTEEEIRNKFKDWSDTQTLESLKSIRDTDSPVYRANCSGCGTRYNGSDGFCSKCGERRVTGDPENDFLCYEGKPERFRRDWPRKLTCKAVVGTDWDYDQVTRNDDLVMYCVSFNDENGHVKLGGLVVFFKRKSASQRYLTTAYGKPYNSRQISLGYLFNNRYDYLIGAMKLLGFDESELF